MYRGLIFKNTVFWRKWQNRNACAIGSIWANLRYSQKKTPSQPKKRGRVVSSFVFAANAMNVLGLLQKVARLSLPFLLISVFAQLLNTEDGYIKQIAKNAAATAGICALFYIAFYRYIVGGIGAFLEDPGEIVPTVQTVIAQIAPGGFVAFNIFVDLFLCALSMFFLNYTPRRVFTGRARILFRLMALIPIAYEVGCMVLILLYNFFSLRNNFYERELVRCNIFLQPCSSFLTFVENYTLMKCCLRNGRTPYSI